MLTSHPFPNVVPIPFLISFVCISFPSKLSLGAICLSALFRSHKLLSLVWMSQATTPYKLYSITPCFYAFKQVTNSYNECYDWL